MRQKLLKLCFTLWLGLGLAGLKAQTTETFTDPRDGNVYHIVTIGEQVWMAENLRYLPSVVGQNETSAKNPLYYVYDYDGTDVTKAKATANYTTYGVLYNWPAAMDGLLSRKPSPTPVQGVCPTGWHLPNDAEWTELANYLGGEDIAGGKLKEVGTNHWKSPNDGATNEFGFTALPGGWRISQGFKGKFALIGLGGIWWSATPTKDANWDREWSIDYNIKKLNSAKIYGEYGLSVRCVKD